MLNYRDETDIYCLHTVFFPLIKKSVEIHRKSWNLHKHRMLRYKSPNSVFKLALGDLKAHSLRNNEKYTELRQVFRYYDHFTVPDATIFFVNLGEKLEVFILKNYLHKKPSFSL